MLVFQIYCFAIVNFLRQAVMMLKPIDVLIFLVLCFSSVLVPVVSAADYLETVELDLALGYRVDQLDWNIAGNYNGTGPTVLSELSWDDLEVLQLQLDAKLETRDLLWLKTNTLFVGKMAYGSIYAGTNQDSDYAGDNRTLEWSRSNNQADDGFTFDASGAFGPKYSLRSGRVSLTPLLGYSVHIQDLSITDGRQTVSDADNYQVYDSDAEYPPPALGPFPGLDSSYRAYWYGPWLGLHLQLAPMPKWDFEITGAYHIVEYFAEADWNLRSDLDHPVSFDHEADGTGLLFLLQSVYELNPHWSLVASGNIQSWQTDAGVVTTYKDDGSRGGTRLNDVNWDSYAYMFGFRYLF